MGSEMCIRDSPPRLARTRTRRSRPLHPKLQKMQRNPHPSHHLETRPGPTRDQTPIHPAPRLTKAQTSEPPPRSQTKNSQLRKEKPRPQAKKNVKTSPPRAIQPPKKASHHSPKQVSRTKDSQTQRSPNKKRRPERSAPQKQNA